jgi:hypothetical protein
MIWFDCRRGSQKAQDKLTEKLIPVVPVPDRPYFFLPTLLFFQRDWPCNPIFSGWLRATPKMASVVTLIIEKTMKKIFKKKIWNMKPEPQVFFYAWAWPNISPKIWKYALYFLSPCNTHALCCAEFAANCFHLVKCIKFPKSSISWAF